MVFVVMVGGYGEGSLLRGRLLGYYYQVQRCCDKVLIYYLGSLKTLGALRMSRLLGLLLGLQRSLEHHHSSVIGVMGVNQARRRCC